MIETRVSPATVWEAWERAHALHGAQKMEPGVRAKITKQQGRGFQYEILDVVPGEKFSILWKTLFVRLVFTHVVRGTKRGSEIRYSFKIQGPFAWIVRLILGNKIKHNLSLVLKAIVKQLEQG